MYRRIGAARSIDAQFVPTQRAERRRCRVSGLASGVRGGTVMPTRSSDRQRRRLAGRAATALNLASLGAGALDASSANAAPSPSRAIADTTAWSIDHVCGLLEARGTSARTTHPANVTIAPAAASWHLPGVL